jgi:hypothetical protein
MLVFDRLGALLTVLEDDNSFRPFSYTVALEALEGYGAGQMAFLE